MVTVLVFQAVLFGAEYAEAAFPEFEQPEGVLDIIQQVLSAIWGVVEFVFSLVTFNVPGAPFWIRVPIATYFGGTIVWSVASLVRGGS